MAYIRKGKRFRLKSRLEFADEQEAKDMGLWQWSELAELFAKSCGQPQGTHELCYQTKECAFCRVREDDANSNPLWQDTHGWEWIPQGLQALINLQEEKQWLVESPRETMQNLFNHTLEGSFSKSDKSRLQNWGFILLRQENATFIKSNLTCCSFVEYEVDIRQETVHMFGIQYDPSNAKYAYMAENIWNISYGGYTKPNANSIGNVIETLLSLWCLAPFFPELVRKLDVDLVKKHARAWMDDLMSASPNPQPKAKIAVKQELMELAGLAAPSSDEEDFFDIQEGPAASADRKRPAAGAKADGANQDGQWAEPRTKKRNPEGDTVETAAGLAGALLGFVQALKETTTRIESFVSKHLQEVGITADHPDCIKMEGLVTGGVLANPPRTVKDDTYETKWFPVISVEEGTMPATLGIEVLREPEAFRQWALEQDAQILGERPNQLPLEEWTSIKGKMVGHLNVGRLRKFQGTKEFWAPLGDTEQIVGEHQKWGNRPLPREAVLKFLTNTLRKEGDELTAQPVYQVLKLEEPDGDRFFWRANKEAEWYRLHMDDDKVAEREATRATRASWYGQKKAAAPAQSGKPFRWGPEQPDRADTGSHKGGQGSKDYFSWGPGNQGESPEHNYQYPQGGQDSWGKGPQRVYQSGACGSSVDAWKDYQSNRMSQDYHERESYKGEGQGPIRGWRKDW